MGYKVHRHMFEKHKRWHVGLNADRDKEVTPHLRNVYTSVALQQLLSTKRYSGKHHCAHKCFRFSSAKFYVVKSKRRHIDRYLSEKHGQAFEKVEEQVARELVVEDSATEVDRSAVLR